jgi:hypothetical protein
MGLFQQQLGNKPFTPAFKFHQRIFVCIRTRAEARACKPSPLVPPFPMAVALVAFGFSQKLPAAALQLFSLPPVTHSFELFAPPDQLLAPPFLRLADTSLSIVILVILW